MLVLALVHLRPAVPVAYPHVKVEAGPLLPNIPGELPAAAGQAQGLAQGVDDALAGKAGAVGPEVPRPVVLRLGGQRKPGVVPWGQPDIGEALAVLEQDVIPGLVALDKRALQHQRLELRLDHNNVEVVDLADHGPGLFVVAGLVLEILAHPVFQRLGLAHIDDLAGAVLHDIHAGF